MYPSMSQHPVHWIWLARCANHNGNVWQDTTIAKLEFRLVSQHWIERLSYRYIHDSLLIIIPCTRNQSLSLQLHISSHTQAEIGEHRNRTRLPMLPRPSHKIHNYLFSTDGPAGTFPPCPLPSGVPRPFFGGFRCDGCRGLLCLKGLLGLPWYLCVPSRWA